MVIPGSMHGLGASRVLGSLVLAGLMAYGPALPGQVQTYRHFDDRDGLPQSQVTSILEDRHGFLWVGTSEGVARLGAAGFQTFGSKQGLKALDVMALMEDRDGAIWVGGQEDGVDRIMGGRVIHYGEEQGLNVSPVYSLFQDRAGVVYAGTRLGLYRLQGGRFEQVPLPGEWNKAGIFAIAGDPGGGLWLASLKNRLGLWDGRNVTPAVLPEPMKDRFRQLAFDAQGRLWALSGDMLLRRDGSGRWSRDPLPGVSPHSRLRRFQITAKGELLLALDTDGLCLRDPSGRARVVTYLDGLPREGIASVFRDGRGDLWLGTDGAGLLAEAVPGLLSLERNPRTGIGLGLGTVLSFQEYGPDRMFIGSTAGLHLWERGKGITASWDQARGLPSNEVWALAPREGGGIWVATLKGLVRWEGGRILKGPKEVANGFVAGLTSLEGRLWVCTFERGLVEMDPSGRFIADHPAPPEVGEPAILSAVPYRGGLLTATRAGCWLFKDGKYTPVLRNTPVGTRSISCLWVGPKGDLWVGTGSDGIVGFPMGENGPCEVYGEANARIHGRVGWIAGLPGGVIAVGHARGLSLLKPGPGGRTVAQITRNLGLLSNETSDSAVYQDRQGRLWVGMVGGVCILDGRTDLPEQGLPRPRILEATAGDLAFGLPESIELPPRPGTLTLRFDAPRPLAPERPSYQVWLDGSWRPVESTSPLFQLARLGPGHLTLKVRAGDGLTWSESGPLDIRVRRAWYQTVPAIAGFALGGAAALVFFFQIRVRAIRRRAEELEAKVAARTEELTLRNRSLERLHHQLKRSLEGRIQLMNTITHDLRSPLTTILLSVDRLEDTEELSEPAHAALKVVSSEAQRVERLLKQLLDGARNESLTDGLRFRVCHPGEILEGLSETLRMKAEARDLAARLDLDRAEGVWVLADAEALQQVVFNLIENALKFTPAPGEIGIRTRLETVHWVLEVWDTGRGIEPGLQAELFRPFAQARAGDASTGWGLGLSICRTLVEAHEGTIEVESEPGRGSVFRVRLPLVTA